jgi:argininosuccinate synthase
MLANLPASHPRIHHHPGQPSTRHPPYTPFPLPLQQQGEELEPARAKAEQMGVKDIFIDDLREEFVRDYVFPMFRANALYEGVYLLGTSIAR